MADSSKRYTGTCSDGRGYVTGSVPMSLDDARRFLLRELESINLGVDQSGTFEGERHHARQVIANTFEPVTLQVGFWKVALELAGGE